MEWYRGQGHLFKPVEFSSVEVIDRLPPAWHREDLEATEGVIREDSFRQRDKMDLERPGKRMEKGIRLGV